MASPKRFPLVVVLVPLVAVLGIAGIVGWNLYREYMRSEADDAEASRQLATAQAEKIKAARAATQPKVEPLTDDDDLGNLPKGQTRPKVKPPAVPSNATPAQRAYLGFKSAYEKLEATNENAARKFRVRKLQLDDQFGNGAPANPTKFVSDCDATRAQILEALRNPENQ